MSFFKKPNRNIRPREIDVQEDDLESKESEVVKSNSTVNKSANQNSEPPLKSVKQTLLSFGEEWEEGDDGEVFQVKKSFQSKKIRRQIDKEREERKKKGSPKIDITGDEKKGKNKIISTEEVTIKIKNPIAGPVIPPERILSGISAEMADYRSGSDEEDQEIQAPRHKFTQPDHVKMLLKSGKIPDAALIHAARKRRQQVREMGGANYIPLEEESSKPELESKSRLIREDDGSDDEERINMSGIVSFAADREKRKEGLDTIITSDAEEDNIGNDEWEVQQIRKVVTEARLAAVQQESLYMQYMNNAAAVAASTVAGVSSLPTQLSTKTTLVSPNAGIVNLFPVAAAENNTAFPQLPTENAVESLDPETIAKKLRERLQKLEEVNKRRDFEFKGMNDEITMLQADYENRKVMVPGLAKRFQFYQDLRGYVTDLVECLDEKIPLIISLEQRLIALYQKQSAELMNRRRQDVKDQMEDLTPTKNLIAIKRDEERMRRAAERDGRRIRRMKNRTLSDATSHIDGMSSDDEITEMASAAYRNQKEIIESDARQVFEDVVDDFVSIDEILKRFCEWKRMDKTAYVEAYANMCLPKVLGPIIRWNMLMWNPLTNAEDVELENLKWIGSIIMYSADKSETEESLRKDPDLQLLPHLIDKIVISKLEQIVKAQWDPLSVTATRQLVSVVQKILEYPFIAPKSKLFTQLINTVIEKMTQAVENDVFIPMLPKQLFDTGKSNVFFQRQFVNSVKLFGNLLCWHGIVNDELLADKANSSLLNRYLLMAIRTLPPLEAANKCCMVAGYLPEAWLKSKGGAVPTLSQFFLYVKYLITQIDYSNPHGREGIEKLTELLKYV